MINIIKIIFCMTPPNKAGKVKIYLLKFERRLLRASNMRWGHIIEIYFFIQKINIISGNCMVPKHLMNSMKNFNLPFPKEISPKAWG